MSTAVSQAEAPMTRSVAMTRVACVWAPCLRETPSEGGQHARAAT
jgi:hypothetical protein